MPEADIGTLLVERPPADGEAKIHRLHSWPLGGDEVIWQVRSLVVVPGWDPGQGAGVSGVLVSGFGPDRSSWCSRGAAGCHGSRGTRPTRPIDSDY
ncbi:hypothetical protein ACFYY2_29340 [Streptomyces sp. NPDC001822]|uniref:hypothetical protein n=1 Tax=Streptomyces sp. NPDC001822 TaxID=3364614 RepID=UPI00368A7280